jgi:Xaa-Pro aminopeptidase
MQIWNQVHLAQTIAFATARKGAIAKSVDQNARAWLRVMGYDRYFTHRLGHGKGAASFLVPDFYTFFPGIGLEVHEAPYLNGGSETILQVGNAFSNEPGVYIEGKVGVRLEDCFYITENGMPKYLTQGIGGPARSPLDP